MSKIRTFVAIDLPQDVKRTISKLITKLQPYANNVRWVETENLHLTLVFLGDVEDRNVHAACRAVSRVCEAIEPFQISLESIGTFPKPNKPRVLWVGIKQGSQEMIDLREAIANKLDEAGFQFDWKFNPHVTIGRFGRARFEDHELVAKLVDFEKEQFGQCMINEVVVNSSTLESGAPIHIRLSTAELMG